MKGFISPDSNNIMPMFQKTEQHSLDSTFIKRVNENMRRLRLAEQRIKNIEDRIGSMEDTMIRRNKNVMSELEKATAEMKKIDEKISVMESSVKRAFALLEKTAKRSELREIENFFELLSPMRNMYVTKDQLRSILKEMKADGQL